MKPHIRYEAAFEDYLRAHQIAHVAVDEAKRTAFRDVKLKSFDFVVHSSHETRWLVDIKGRRWATRRGQARPSWENWVTQADLDGLVQWQEVFGLDFRALLVFAYRIETAASPPAEVVHEYRDRRYVFVGIPLDEYRLHARVRSPKWGTVNIPKADFAAQVRPIAHWL